MTNSRLTLKHMVMWLALTSPLAGAVVMSVPCIPDGDTDDVTFTTSLSDPGTPANAEVLPGSGEGMESDISFDDSLGPASQKTVSGTTTFTIPIGNKSGKLSGPNGVSQNGGTEGPCIEVYVRFTIRYTVTVCVTEDLTLSYGGVGGSTGTSECWDEWRHKTMRFLTPIEVCPC